MNFIWAMNISMSKYGIMYGVCACVRVCVQDIVVTRRFILVREH